MISGKRSPPEKLIATQEVALQSGHFLDLSTPCGVLSAALKSSSFAQKEEVGKDKNKMLNILILS